MGSDSPATGAYPENAPVSSFIYPPILRPKSNTLFGICTVYPAPSTLVIANVY